MSSRSRTSTNAPTHQENQLRGKIKNKRKRDVSKSTNRGPTALSAHTSIIDKPIVVVKPKETNKIIPSDQTYCLPDTVVLYVLTLFLDPPSMSSLGQCNKRWYQLLQKMLVTALPRRDFGNRWYDTNHKKLSQADWQWYLNYRTHKHPQFMISASTAKSVFRITDRQCSKLPVVVVPNPLYARAAPMSLMKISDAFIACIERHATVAGLILYRETFTFAQETACRDNT